jgi:hypothetical protein
VRSDLRGVGAGGVERVLSGFLVRVMYGGEGEVRGMRAEGEPVLRRRASYSTPEGYLEERGELRRGEEYSRGTGSV